MKKTLLAMLLVFSGMSASAQETVYQSLNLNGLQVYGCEIYIENSDGLFGTPMANVTRYVYENKTDLFMITYHGGSTSTSSTGFHQFSLTVKKADLNSFIRKFQHLKNKCAFVTP